MFHTALLNQQGMNAMYLRKSKEKKKVEKRNIILPAQLIFLPHSF